MVPRIVLRGIFSVSLFYKMLASRRILFSPAKMIRGSKAPLEVQDFMWLLSHKAILI